MSRFNIFLTKFLNIVDTAFPIKKNTKENKNVHSLIAIVPNKRIAKSHTGVLQQAEGGRPESDTEKLQSVLSAVHPR